MAGADLPARFRQVLGHGQVVAAHAIAAKMQPFDADGDGALTRDELIAFLVSTQVGGRWFCSVVAQRSWAALEANFEKPITWIKITALAEWLHLTMKLAPREPKRIRLTPEGAAGYEPLLHLDGTPADPNPQIDAPVAKSVPPVNSKDASGLNPLTRPPPRPQAPAPAATATPQRGPTGQPIHPPSTGTRPQGATRPSRPVPRRPGPRR